MLTKSRYVHWRFVACCNIKNCHTNSSAFKQIFPFPYLDLEGLSCAHPCNFCQIVPLMDKSSKFVIKTQWCHNQILIWGQFFWEPTQFDFQDALNSNIFCQKFELSPWRDDFWEEPLMSRSARCWYWAFIFLPKAQKQKKNVMTTFKSMLSMSCKMRNCI